MKDLNFIQIFAVCLTYTALTVIAIVFVWFINHEWKKYQSDQRVKELRYDMLYLHLNDALSNPPEKAKKEYLLENIKKLGQMEYKNREKTAVILKRFLTSYRPYLGVEDFFALQQYKEVS
jgi:hypothetical protein